MLQLFAVPRLTSSSESLNLPLNKPFSLLAYLAFRADWVSRDELLLLYYADIDEKSARHRLRQLAYRAKKYDWAAGFEQNDDSFRWLIDNDAKQFQDAMRQNNYAEALKFYQGEFLAGLKDEESAGYETWLELTRNDLKLQWLEAASKHSGELERRGAYTDAVTVLSDVWQQEPLAEMLLQSLMRCHYLNDSTRDALDCFERFKTLLHEEMGIEPEAATLELAQNIANNKLVAARPHNLPAQSTPFVGREAELEQIGELLKQENCRLLTLTGTGGMGKTRLALQAANRQIGQFEHGVFFVPLAPVASHTGVAAAAADALNLSSHGQASLAAQVLDFVRDKDVLLVLDNFEHVLKAALWLTDLLEQSPRLHILVTSRERLKVQAEHQLKLHGLDVPESDARLEHSASVQLFIQSAKRLKPKFALQDNNRDAIANICRLVGGMPLAIELAASWITLLSPKDIQAEIERDVGFLSSDLQDFPERHKNIEALLEASWQRLDEDAKQGFRSLSIFPSSFSQEAAQAVTGAGLRQLLVLEQRSLLQRNAQGHFETHPLLRQFASKKRQDESDTDTLEQAMAQYYCQFLAERIDTLFSENQDDTLQDIDADLQNILTALHYAVEHHALRQLSHALDSLYHFYFFRGWFSEAIEVFAGIIEALQNQADSLDHYIVLKRYQRCWLFFQHRSAKSRLIDEQLDDLMDFFEYNNMPGDLRFCMEMKAYRSFRQGAFETAKQLYLEMLESVPDGKDYPEKISILNNLGNVYTRLGDWQAAQGHYEHALKLSRHVGSPRQRAHTLIRLGDLYSDFGNYDESLAAFQEGLRLYQNMGNQYGIAVALNNVATVYHVLKDYPQASRYYRQSLRMSESVGDRAGIALSHLNLAEIAYDEKRFMEAVQEFEDALQLYKAVGYPWYETKAASLLASAYLANNQSNLAATTLREAVTNALELGSNTMMLDVLIHAANYLNAVKDIDPTDSFRLIWHHPNSYEDQRVLIRNILEDDAATFELPEAMPEDLTEVLRGVLEDI